jgi:hypothetical protein
VLAGMVMNALNSLAESNGAARKMCALPLYQELGLDLATFDFNVFDWDPKNPLFKELQKILHALFLTEDIELAPYEGFSGKLGRILDILMPVLGEEHQLAQELTAIIVDRTEMAEAKSFVMVHKKLLGVRAQAAEHRPVILDNGITLNLMANTQPFKMHNTIIMPASVWRHLFEDLRENSDVFKTFDCNADLALSLENERMFLDFLDPELTEEAPQDISVANYQFRTVLDAVRGLLQGMPEDKATARNIFAQLLVNIQTCTTGKTNGIFHSYNMLTKGVVVEENGIDTERFVEEIQRHFEEELRKLRTGTLTKMLSLGLKIDDPDGLLHGARYIRGAIGADVGLMRIGEVPSVDLNGSCVPDVVQNMSKQDLLGLFYRYYNPESVIDRALALLNKKSNFESASSDKNLVPAIIGKFFPKGKWDNDEYTVIDNNFTPTEFKPAAAEELLIQLGFLTHESRQTKPYRIDDNGGEGSSGSFSSVAAASK